MSRLTSSYVPKISAHHRLYESTYRAIGVRLSIHSEVTQRYRPRRIHGGRCRASPALEPMAGCVPSGLPGPARTGPAPAVAGRLGRKPGECCLEGCCGLGPCRECEMTARRAPPGAVEQGGPYLTDLVMRRFEHYFRHPDWHHDVLGPGDRAIACRNARRALSWLGVYADEPAQDEDLFDESLRAAVREFQVKYGHRVADGQIGPGTRSRLTSEILHKFDPSIFQRLRRPEQRRRPSIFLSYAWRDAERVDKLDQWLRDHGVQVIRDKDSFVAGDSIQENISRAVSAADKIVVVLSQHSRFRDWPLLERAVAEQLESRIGTSVLIYLQLDDTSLPVHDPTRVAISAAGVPLKQVGERLLHAVTGKPLTTPNYPYDENEPL